MKLNAQVRADWVIKRIESIMQNRGIDQGRFKALAKNFPAMIHMNGLGQALAFCKTKSTDPAYGAMIGIVQGWLAENGPYAIYPGKDDLLKAAVAGDRAAYMNAQIEAIELLQWVKRFAVAMIDAEERDD